MADPEIPEHNTEWEAEVKAMSERLAHESRRSGVIGFLGGVVVMGGLAILVWATLTQVNKSKTLATEVTKRTVQTAKAQAEAAEATAATQQAVAARNVLNAAVENLQAQNPSASATSAVDQAFDANPNAARLLARVYIHTPAQQRKLAMQAAKALRNAGFIVPGIDVKPEISKATEVHYYMDDSQSISDANSIAKVVIAAGIPCGTRQVPQPAADKLKPRAYGLWLAPDVQ